MPHLNAIINEALTLHPALPSGGLRQTPQEGLTITGQFIPGNVVISAPRYSLGRRKCYASTLTSRSIRPSNARSGILLRASQ